MDNPPLLLNFEPYLQYDPYDNYVILRFPSINQFPLTNSILSTTSSFPPVERCCYINEPYICLKLCTWSDFGYHDNVRNLYRQCASGSTLLLNRWQTFEANTSIKYNLVREASLTEFCLSVNIGKQNHRRCSC